jgi:hypothetical protein
MDIDTGIDQNAIISMVILVGPVDCGIAADKRIYRITQWWLTLHILERYHQFKMSNEAAHSASGTILIKPTFFSLCQVDFFANCLQQLQLSQDQQLIFIRELRYRRTYEGREVYIRENVHIVTLSILTIVDHKT